MEETATGLKENAEALRGDAKDLTSKADDEVKSAQATKDEADKETEEAEKAIQDAKDLVAKAEKMKKDAAEKAEEMKKEAEDQQKQAEKDAKDLQEKSKELQDKAKDMKTDSKKKTNISEQRAEHAEELKQKADETKKKAEQNEQTAADDEDKSLKETADQRTCIKLPGVKLKGGQTLEFPALVGNQTIDDEWKCSDWCQKLKGCKQAVFQWETKTCELFEEAQDEPERFRERWPGYNSTYCGAPEEQEDMLAKLKKVYDAKPWVPPPHNCSWASESCLDTGCCADVCMATWDFVADECQYYTCYKRDENFAGCKTGGPPEGWDGTVLGGHPNGEVAPAPEGKLVQGTRLYCFTVVMWDKPPDAGWMSSEGEIANHWKEEGKNIMQCDDHSFFDGQGGGSVHNIQSFISAWNMVKDAGLWKNNDWSIKVDPDAVFFPDHFRAKVQYNWRTPQGATLYMRNTFYKFQFLGALEALTNEATEIFLERSWECEAHLGQEGGEDYWLLQCLEGLGIDFQTDVALLHDKYAADENCGDPNGVAHHFFKKIDSGDGWDNCWNTANEAWNNAHPE